MVSSILQVAFVNTLISPVFFFPADIYLLQKLWQEWGGWRFTADYNRNQERRRSKNCASIVTWRRVAGWIGRLLGCL